MLFFKSAKSESDAQLSTINALLNSTSSQEGRLAIDVFKLNDNLVVRSTIAGASIDDLDITIDGNLLSIKGRRSEPQDIDYQDYLYRECYWGNFARTVSLPFLIDEDGVEASLEEGILTVILPIKAESYES
jgi:HSP20 family protein